MDATLVLDRYFQEPVREHRFSGVVLVTQGEEELYAAAYGYASRPWQARNRLDTRFDTASITKLFTSVATLQLIERGLLAFDMVVDGQLDLQEA